jgi:hypothetical protein
VAIKETPQKKQALRRYMIAVVGIFKKHHKTPDGNKHSENTRRRKHHKTPDGAKIIQ